jgi:CheY-like chemotaxis protein
MSSMTDNTHTIAVLVDDMFFGAKINNAASVCGRAIDRIKSQEQLAALAANAPALIIIDLNSDRLDPLEAIRYLKTNTDLARIPIVAFVSHVQTELIRSAQATGCDYVLPRSVFTQLLGEIVVGNLEMLKGGARD